MSLKVTLTASDEAAGLQGQGMSAATILASTIKSGSSMVTYAVLKDEPDPMGSINQLGFDMEAAPIYGCGRAGWRPGTPTTYRT
jgi:hypothetical protein